MIEILLTENGCLFGERVKFPCNKCELFDLLNRMCSLGIKRKPRCMHDFYNKCECFKEVTQ